MDLAVIFTDEPASTLGGPAARIAAELERALARPADVVVLNRVPADLPVLRRYRRTHAA